MLESVSKKNYKIWFITLAFSLSIILGSFGIYCGKARSIENLETFARLYGYVKYFYPGDEAAALDWDRFAVYGTKQVEKAKNSSELKKILEELFLPIAPALEIYNSKQQRKFSLEAITPPHPEKMKVITWLHYGVGFKKIDSVYKSIRINRKNVLHLSSQGFGNVFNIVDASPFRGKQFRFNASVRSEDSNGRLWLRIDRSGGKIGFFDNMGDRPIQSNEWKNYEITGIVDEDAEKLSLGCLLIGAGKIWVDDISLMIKEGEDESTWKNIPLKHSDFEGYQEGQKPSDWRTAGQSYQFLITASTAAEGEKSLSIKSNVVALTEPVNKFENQPGFGEHISKEIGSGLSCNMPIALMGSEEYTFPKSPKDKLTQLTSAIKNEVTKKLSADNLYVRLADITIAWNVFQHFYPYFDIVKTDWREALTEGLSSAYHDKNKEEFLDTLKLLVAKLKDGHGGVRLVNNTEKIFLIPINWSWIEDQLVITNIYDKDLTHIHVGDIVMEINGVSAAKALQEKEKYISSATPGWKRFRALNFLLHGKKDEQFQIKIKRDGTIYKEVLSSNLFIRNYHVQYEKDLKRWEKLEDGIFYLNLDTLFMSEINKLMPELETAKAIICDLRGYPNGNHSFIQHLLKEKENTLWMWIPKVVYPDFQQVVYDKLGWSMEPKKPALRAKIVFITDSRAISYAESFLSYIEGFKLATIVGESTAGTNGNVNPFELPGEYRVTWTGMRVVKHDGTQHHGIGIIPDIHVKRTIKGVKQGRDEFLEKALEIAKE